MGTSLGRRPPPFRVVLGALLALGGGSGCQVTTTATPLGGDGGIPLPDGAPGETVELPGTRATIGTRQHLSVVIMQGAGRQPALSEAKVRDRLLEAARAAQDATSDADVACCFDADAFSISVFRGARDFEYAPQNEDEVQALINRELGTIIVVESIGKCSPEGGIDPIGCGYAPTGRIVVRGDAPPEAWLHELGHARGLTGPPNNGHRPSNAPECDRGRDLDEKPVMCPVAPVGGVLNPGECDALTGRVWPAPQMAGAQGASAEGIACKIER